jgi:hypothetical protein
MLIMSVLGIDRHSLEALFMVGSMRGSEIRSGSESRQSRWQAIAHGKMINPLFPSLALLLVSWLLLADLTLLTPV